MFYSVVPDRILGLELHKGRREALLKMMCTLTLEDAHTFTQIQ